MSESTEEKYRRLQREIQGAILRNYPNPNRQGCPGDASVRSLAANPDSIKAEDDADEQGAWYHICLLYTSPGPVMTLNFHSVLLFLFSQLP